MGYCEICGKATKGDYTFCYECYKEAKKAREYEEGLRKRGIDPEEATEYGIKKKGITIDQHKKYTLELWVIGAIFAAGFILGAWLL